MAEVRKNEAASRFEMIDGGEVIGIADYRERDGYILLPHTEITPARRGTGLGAELVRVALDDARASGLPVVPTCWYVAQFINENPEYHDLVA